MFKFNYATGNVHMRNDWILKTDNAFVKADKYYKFYLETFSKASGIKRTFVFINILSHIKSRFRDFERYYTTSKNREQFERG